MHGEAALWIVIRVINYALEDGGSLGVDHHMPQPVLPLLTIVTCLIACTGCFNKINERNKALGNEIVTYLKAHRGEMSDEQLVIEVNNRFKLDKNDSIKVYVSSNWADEDAAEEDDEEPLPDIEISIHRRPLGPFYEYSLVRDEWVYNE